MNLDELELAEEIIDPQEALRDAWLAERHGRITASRFGDLMKSGREKDAVFTQTGYAYLRRCLAERLGSYYSVSAKSMDWGNEHESEAIAEYEKRFGVQVESCRYRYFPYNDDIGGTPDGLVGDEGCIEIKCPYDPAVHINTCLTRQVPDEYEWQVHGHMLVTGRKWVDFCSFDPRIPEDDDIRLCVIRVNRDEQIIAKLLERLQLAANTLEEMGRELRRK